jgi:dTDP-4-dehydrorhamnose 3,5-epimerase
MIFTKLKIDGLFVIEPKVFGDDRGYFFESYNKKEFEQNGIFIDFVQDNNSHSIKGVVRGLHFQKPPFAQDKLVSVSQGKVIDVAVDLRPSSPTFGQYEMVELSGENKKMFLIPKGFAHGFVALSETVDFQYKCSNFYNKESEGGIVWNDPDLNISWNVSNPIVSEKDQILPKLAEIKNELIELNW